MDKITYPAPHKQKPIGYRLLEKGAISEDQLRIAIQEQKRNHQPLGRLLVGMGFLSESVIRDVLSERLGQESVDVATVPVDPAAIQLIPQEIARRYQLLPLSLNVSESTLTVAMADPCNVIALDQLHALIKDLRVIPQQAGESAIMCAIDQHYGSVQSIDGILHEIQPNETTHHPSRAGVNEFSHPVVRLINALLTEAVKFNASDIHFEPEISFLRIRYRIDGVLRQVHSLHKSFWPAMVVRLKVLCEMNIAETRAPQDGRLTLRLSGRPIDFRVASHPTAHGENVVLRILDRQKGIVPIEQIGLDEKALHTLKLIVAKPEGIVLVTGPTGCGKTTTLYSILNHVNTESVNIMTLEDPVEYPVPLIRQTSVNETAKLDFVSGIRSIMRQDPDIILVGEIRDHATAEMAFRAAMTGHQVYSTLHTNSAIGAIPRLLDIGILPDIMAGNIIGIIAQRLVRVLCPQCKYSQRPDALEYQMLGISHDEDIQLCRAAGCTLCHQTGYSGRIAIMELLKMDSDLDDLVACRASIRSLKKTALEKGFRPLAAEGIRHALLGITSLAEVARVVDLTDRMN
ncbi:MAG: ATPase, T2SS/T4P/T4SS family [Pseudomonadota bacterium]